jgi:gliding motility-associated-like protein
MIRCVVYMAILFSIVNFASAESSKYLQPMPPVLQLVSVDHSSAAANLSWSPGPSTGVTGYVIYRFINNEGYAIDTIRNPAVLNYTDTGTGALFYSQSYVVAALDAEDNVSPLSNSLNTIYLDATLDTCNLQVNLSWTGFSPSTSMVTGYEILISSGGAFSTAVTKLPSETSHTLAISDFHTTYTYMVRAILSNGQWSDSNQKLILTNLASPPAWIQISAVTVNTAGVIDISISYDPASEINQFRIERKSATGDAFSTIGSVNSSGGSFIFTDVSADVLKRHIYRASAVNNCNIAAINSGEATNIALSGEINDFLITLNWNSYLGWSEGISRYSVYVKTGEFFTIKAELTETDTSYTADYRDIMYELVNEAVCFYIMAERGGNFNPMVTSSSNIICFESSENIFVPNAFTPDDNGLNDLWKPVLSFTPVTYHLVVRSRTGGSIFETDTFLQSWDGTYRGSKLPPDVYLWHLKVVTPSGRKIERRGTLALIYNQSRLP